MKIIIHGIGTAVNTKRLYSYTDVCTYRFTMIEKLCLVMGIQYMSDPDDSYVLTIDNMKKMLAIKMRFR